MANNTPNASSAARIIHTSNPDSEERVCETDRLSIRDSFTGHQVDQDSSRRQDLKTCRVAILLGALLQTLSGIRPGLTFRYQNLQSRNQQWPSRNQSATREKGTPSPQASKYFTDKCLLRHHMQTKGQRQARPRPTVSAQRTRRPVLFRSGAGWLLWRCRFLTPVIANRAFPRVAVGTSSPGIPLRRHSFHPLWLGGGEVV